MKKMNTYLTIILILLFNNVYSQIPIGKNIKLGKTEFISFMKRNGFTLLKDQKEEVMKYNIETGKADIHTGNFSYSLLFKEEVEVLIYYNKYSNISEVYMFPENQTNKLKLLKILKSNTWEPLEERQNGFTPGPNLTYKVKEYYAMITTSGIMQINFYSHKP